MVAIVANSALNTVATLISQPHTEFGGKKNVDTPRIRSKLANASIPFRIIKTENDEVTPLSSPSQRASTCTLSDWSMLFSAIITRFTKKIIKRSHDNLMLLDSFGYGKFVQNGLVFRQKFSIRSYEIGANGVRSLETIMNHLQETVLNHLKCMGLLGDGLGSTPEMCKRKLIWVTTKVQIVIDRYPAWGDTVQIEDRIVRSGKNSMRRDSLIQDCKTGEVLVKASSNWVMMNKETRKLSRIPDEVQDEMGPYLMDAPPIVENESKPFAKLNEATTDYTHSGLKPKWNDLDLNQHVNNAKYIGWILESTPPSFLKNHELSRITLEYKKECRRDSVLQSLTTLSNDHLIDSDYTECQHLLRLEDGLEIMKARTEWKPKHANGI